MKHESNAASSDRGDHGEQLLLERARTGDMAACEVLMRRYNRRLYRVIRSVLKTGSDVEDTMQDTYVAALGNLDRFEGRARFGTWLLTIGTNAALARMRQRMRVVQLDDLPDLDELDPRADFAGKTTPTPEQQVANGELVALVQQAVDRLPYDYRQVFMLRTIEGLSTTETAEVLGLREEVVRQRLHRAREMIQSDVRHGVGPAVPAAFEFLGLRCDRVVAGVLRRLSSAREVFALG